MNRRAFVQGSVVAAISPVLPARSTFASSCAKIDGDDVMLAIADERYTESMAFAQTIRPTGEGLLMFKFDLAQLWFGELLPRLRKRTPVLGLTLESDLFVVRHLAEGLGLRVQYVGLHDWRNTASSVHTLSGTTDLGGIVTALSRHRDFWPVALARALVTPKSPSLDWQDCEARLDLSRAQDNPRFLASWAFA
jgi:hypothetical protein